MSNAVEIQLAAIDQRSATLRVSVSSLEVSIEALLPLDAPKWLAGALRVFPKHSEDWLCAEFRNKDGDTVLVRFESQDAESTRVEICFKPSSNKANPELSPATFCATAKRSVLDGFLSELQAMQATGDRARLELAA